MTLAHDDPRMLRVAALTELGWSITAIAAHLDIGESTVANYRRRTGTSKAPTAALSDAELARAKAFLDDGCTYSETSRSVGRSEGVIHRYFPGYEMSINERAVHAAMMRKFNRMEKGNTITEVAALANPFRRRSK